MSIPTTDAELLGPMIDIRSPVAITNPDANNMIYWCDSYLVEFSRCSSATRRETTAHDRGRMHSCINTLRLRVTTFTDFPELDRPKYHPEDIPVSVPPKLNRIENADVQHFIDSLVAIRIQMSFMDSAERASVMSASDKNSALLEFDKLDKFMNDVLDVFPDNDLPDADFQEPTPQAPIRSNY